MRVLGGSDSSLLTAFTQGLDVDVLMYKEEIEVQKKWAIELCESSYLTPTESEKFLGALSEIYHEIETDKFKWSIADEDIHMNIERALTEKLGDLGKKVHLGRSRNDLVATTQRLFVHNKLEEVDNFLNKVIDELVVKAEKYLDVIIPGMTHLQSGQPVRYSHTVLAHAHAFKRDSKKIKYAKGQCLENLPLGAAAFSGTHLNLNLERIAKNLNFKNALYNSYDAVGDRDFILDGLDALSSLAVHLNRLCHEIIYYSSSSVGFIKLPKNWTTGSSIMPNKRNPDTIEITRAKMARVISSSNEAKQLVSQVIPSYGSDLHELKRTFIKSYNEVNQSLEVLIPFINEMEINEQAAEVMLNKGHILATEFANLKTSEKDGEFRDAYLKTKEMVDQANALNIQVHELDNWPSELSFKSSVDSRTNSGGTSLESCKIQISYFKN